jgi:PAS domain S-box-containing protein
MQYTLFLILSPISAIILTATIIIIARTPRSELSTNLLVMISISLGFLFTNTLELICPTEAGTMFYAKLGYPLSTFTPAFTFFFTLAFTGNDGWLTPRNKLLTLAIPILLSLLAFTEPLHGLVWKRISYTPVNEMLAMNVSYGWAYWIGFIYMLRETFHAQRVYRIQGILAVTGIGIPLALFLVYSLKLIPGFTKNYSPIAYAAAGLCFVASIRQHRLLDLIPIARSALIDDIADSMIVVDAGGRIVDANKAARGLLGPIQTVIGASIGDHPELRKILAGDDGQARAGELCFLSDGTLRYFDARVSRIRGRGDVSMGSIILLRDVTDTHLYMEEKNRLIDELTRAAREIKTLEGIIPICMYCKKIRDDAGYWHQVEQFVGARSNAQFSHGMCPECQKKLEENGYRMKP